MKQIQIDFNFHWWNFKEINEFQFHGLLLRKKLIYEIFSNKLRDAQMSVGI